MRAEEHLYLGEGSFALLRHAVHARGEAPDLLDVSPGPGPHVDVWCPARVRQRDDGRHGAPAIPCPFVELERSFEPGPRLAHDGRDRERLDDLGQRLTGGHSRQDLHPLPRQHLFDEPRAATRQGHDPQLAVGGGQR